jgi:hypothetical protein
MKASADYSNNQYANASQAGFDNKSEDYSYKYNKTKYDPQANRTAGEDMAKKKGFSFVQKASLAGAGITTALFFIKSKILTFLSFLTAIPTAGLLYFGFFTGKKAEPVKPEIQEEKPKEYKLSPESYNTIAALNSLKEESKDTLLKDFIHHTVQALAAKNNFEPEGIAHELTDTLDYQINIKEIKKLQKLLHPDSHIKSKAEKQELYRDLFKIITSYKELTSS